MRPQFIFRADFLNIQTKTINIKAKQNEQKKLSI